MHFAHLRPALVPIFGALPVQRRTISAFIKTCEAARGLLITPLRRSKIPPECLLRIGPYALTELVTDPDGVLSLDHSFICRGKFKPKSLFLVPCNAPPMKITLPQPINSRLIAV